MNETMIIIHGIDYQEVYARSEVKLEVKTFNPDPGPNRVNHLIKTETVRPIEFCKEIKGKIVKQKICMPKHVSDVLGISFELFNEQNRQLQAQHLTILDYQKLFDQQQMQIYALENKINRLKNASLWKRIKQIFTGVKL